MTKKEPRGQARLDKADQQHFPFIEPPARRQVPADDLPLLGLAVELERALPCQHDGNALINPGKGPHRFSLRCCTCGAHVGWLSNDAAKFIDELARKFGAPSEPIKIRATPPKEQP
jgi:hypothetical protein